MVRAVELDERSVPRPCQEFGVNEARQQHSARVPIQSPEPAGLRLCQAEPGHLEKLALNSTKQGVGYRAGCRCHGCHLCSPPPVFPQLDRSKSVAAERAIDVPGTFMNLIGQNGEINTLGTSSEHAKYYLWKGIALACALRRWPAACRIRRSGFSSSRTTLRTQNSRVRCCAQMAAATSHSITPRQCTRPSPSSPTTRTTSSCSISGCPTRRNLKR